jgi:hypothetical protein
VEEFDDDLDAPVIKMRMVAIWEAQEAMETGVSEREHPPASSGEWPVGGIPMISNNYQSAGLLRGGENTPARDCSLNTQEGTTQ